MKDSLLETLENMMAPNAEGHFWLGSTSYGRSLIDKAPLVEEIIPLAVEALRARLPNPHPQGDRSR